MTFHARERALERYGLWLTWQEIEAIRQAPGELLRGHVEQRHSGLIYRGEARGQTVYPVIGHDGDGRPEVVTFLTRGQVEINTGQKRRKPRRSKANLPGKRPMIEGRM